MSDSKPTPEETESWQRRLASQANNRAWQLTEQTERTPAEDEQMLQAAHAAGYFWNLVGDAQQRALAALLVAHVYASLRQPVPAAHYWEQAEAPLAEGEPWVLALVEAVAANLAAARQDAAAHRRHYRQAVEQIAALPDPEDREILEATLRALPVPDASA